MQVCVFTYARTRAYVHVCLGSAEDKAWWNWRHFAGGAGAGVPALVPFPRRISVSEMESLLRFVEDPEDAALLMRWFPLESNPLASSSQVPPTADASTETRGKNKSKSMQAPARGPEQGDSPQGTEIAQVAPSTWKTDATASLGQGPALGARSGFARPHNIRHASYYSCCWCKRIWAVTKHKVNIIYLQTL